MRAIDTNIVVRFLRRDDKGQSSIADEILGAPCFVPISVMIEVAWVLGSFFKVPRQELAGVLRDFVDLATVHTEDLPLTQWAIERYGQGADLADMLHLVASRAAAEFATFDRELSRRAGANPPLPIETFR